MQLPSNGIHMPDHVFMKKKGVPRSGSVYGVVTREIIKKSRPEDSGHCMVAQALRIQRGATSVRVTTENISFNWNGMRYNYTMPGVVAVRLLDFDRRKTTEPFPFILDGRTMTSRPIVKKAKHGRYKAKDKVKATRKAKGKATVRKCKRRFRGLRVMEIHGRQTVAKAT